jgi:hypothetical protein
MASNDVIFKVHHGGQFDRRNKCIFGRDIGLYEKSYDLDCLSFFEIETVVRKFGYHLIYYREPDRDLDDGLVLLTSDADAIRMAEVHLGHKLILLYTISFANAGDEVGSDVGGGDEVEDSGDEERRMKIINDPYWRSLMSDDDDAWDGADELEAGTSNRDVDFLPDFDEGDFDKEDGRESDVASCHDEGCHEEGGNEKVAQLETTNVGGSSSPATLDGQLLDDVEEDEVSFNFARSDILITPPKSDEEYEVASRAKCVTKTFQFEDVDMEDPHLDVGMSFESVAQFRKAMREYNLFRGKDVLFTKNYGDCVIGVCRSRTRVVLGEFMAHW